MNGSRNAVSGCGTTSMSLSLIACQPRMLEPSKPRPSSNTSSSSLFTGIVKCCQIPGKSMNRRSTALTSFSRHSAKTSLGFTASPLSTKDFRRSSIHPPVTRRFGTESARAQPARVGTAHAFIRPVVAAKRPREPTIIRHNPCVATGLRKIFPPRKRQLRGRGNCARIGQEMRIDRAIR